ncbi:hypothetical protein KJ564_07540 [bacterium]|nr:hypothetical protein [bacterium]
MNFSPPHKLTMTDLGKKTISVLFMLPLALILASAAVGSSNYFILIVVSGIIFFSVLTSFTASLILIGFASFFLSYSIWFFNLPGPLINLGYVLILMVLIREYFFTANLLPVRTPINTILFAIMGMGLLSIAAGDMGAYPAFKGLFRHIAFPFLFLLILIAEPDERLMKRLVIGVIIVAFVQVIASAMQFSWYTVIAPKDAGMRADFSGGILGYSCGGYNSIFMAMTFALLLGMLIVRGFKLYLAIGAVALLAPVFLSSARAGVPMFAATALFMLVFAPLPRHGPWMGRLILATVLTASILIIAASGLAGQTFKDIFDISYITEYSSKQSDAGMGRLQALDVVSSSLRTPLEQLVGRGPGALTPTSITQNDASLIANNPLLFATVTGYAYTTIEIGFVGLVLFLLLYIQVYRFTRRFLKEIDDPFWESIALGFQGTIFIYVISTFYIDSWVFFPLPFAFWAMAAAIYRIGVLKEILRV